MCLVQWCMMLSRPWKRSHGPGLNDLLATCFFRRLQSTPNSVRTGGGTEECGQRNGRAMIIVLVPRSRRIAVGAQVSRNLFQRRGTDAGLFRLAILYTLDPWLDSRILDWSR
jgi:hypothetical protein